VTKDDSLFLPASNDETRIVEGVRAVGFAKAFRGYAPDEVDTAISKLTEALEQLQGELRQLSADAQRESTLRRTAEEQIEIKRHELIEAERRLNETIGDHDQLVSAVEAMSKERTNVLATLEEVRVERAERIAYTEQLEEVITRYEQAEQSVAHVLDAAERSGNEVRSIAQREAALIIEDARVRAREELFANSSERDRLMSHARTIRTMLSNALFAIDERGLDDAAKE
jgi:DivIVA domain-containing protein